MKCNIKSFKALVDVAANLVDEGVIQVSHNELKMRVMDPSQISMICADMPISADDSEIGNYGLNFAMLKKSLLLKGSGELEIKKGSENNLIFSNSGNSLSMAILELGDGQVKEPQIVHESLYRFDSKLIKTVLKSVDSKRVRFNFNSSLDVVDRGENGVSQTFRVPSEVIKPGSGSVAYPMQFLKDIFKGSKGQIDLYLQSDRPLKTCYSVEGVNFAFWVAPRIEEDDYAAPSEVEPVQAPAVEVQAPVVESGSVQANPEPQ